MKVLFATTNPAKIKAYATRLEERGYEIVTLKDLEITTDVEETGKSPVENAIIKAKAYHEISKLPTIALDDALFLENVPENLQPKTNVRRVNGKRLNDEEMIEHYTGLVNQYGKAGKLSGYFQKGIAIATDEKIESFETKSTRCFSNTRCDKVNEGYPLASIQWIEELNKYKAELTKGEEDNIMAQEQKEILGFIESKTDKLKAPKIDVKKKI